MRPGTKKTASFLFIFFAVWLSARYLLPLIFPFLLGAALALAAEPMVKFLCKRLHLPRSLAAGLGVGMAFCMTALLVLLLCAFIVRELKILAGVLPDLEETTKSGISLLQNWLLGLTVYTPQSIQPLLQQNVSALFSGGTAILDKAIRYVLGLAGGLLSHIPDSALSLGTGIISAFMISARLPRIQAWIKKILPREKLQSILTALKRVKTAVFGWLTAQCKLMGMTFLFLTVGFWILQIPHALLWALGVSAVDAFPVLGTGTILFPWALICFLQGNTARAIGLIGVYAVISVSRSVLEPKLVGKQLGLDPLVTLIALYAGYKIWGIGGMILAPLLTVTAIQLVPEKKG